MSVASNVRSKQSTGPRGLSRSAMVTAAIDLMEEGGASGFSLRRLGERIGCDPMAILYHFKSKDGLFRAMAEALTSRVEPVDPALPWADRLAALAHAHRRVALASPRSFALMQRYLSTGRADFAQIEAVHGALHEAGHAPGTAARLCLGWYAVVFGLALAEVQGMIRPTQADDLAELDGTPPEALPRLREALGMLRDLDPGEVFSNSLDCLHEGIRLRAVLG